MVIINQNGVMIMKSTGILRQLDSAGRIVIPKELRTMLDLKENSDYIEIFTQGEYIMLRKYSPCCIFCDGIEDVIDYSGKKVCRACAAKLFERSRNL
jgi:transcriptional pleiotropic regulator of transition state genes